MTAARARLDAHWFAIPAVRAGSFVDDDGTGGCRWAVFDRGDVEDATMVDLDSRYDDDGDLIDLGAIAESLTGWHRFESGPGRAFGHPPVIRVRRNRVLVYQRTGLDV